RRLHVHAAPMSARAAAVLLALGLATPARAQTNDHLFRSWRWTTDSTSPRAAGLAGAMTAVADDVSAALHNPAGLAGLTKSELAASVLSRRPGEAAPGDTLAARTGIGFAGVAARIGSRLVVAGTLAEGHARRVRLDPARALPDGVPESGACEAIVTDMGLAAGWQLTPRVHLGARVARSRLALEGELSREPEGGPVELRVAASGEAARISSALGVVVQPLRRLKLAATAASGVRWRLTRTAVSPLLGSVLDPGSGFDVRQPAVISAGVSVEPSLKLRLSAQVDRVRYGEIRSSLVIGQGAHRRQDYALDDAWEPRLGVEVSFPRRVSSLQLRGGVHWRAGGALRYAGENALERAAFAGAERQVVAAAGASLVTARWLRLDLAVQLAGERSQALAGLAGRF
ncbi:MAG TPA: hypothetical protein VFO85_13955, partial [Vicinamibacteria bacterium]|nr:hypothetical protein [Vicinamibacteria bacterium]